MSDVICQIATCPDDATRMRCVLGALPPDELESVSTHIDDCAICQTTIADIGPPSDEFLESLRQPVASGGFEEDPDAASIDSRMESLAASLSDSRQELPSPPPDSQDIPPVPPGEGRGVGQRADVDKSVSAADRVAKDADGESPGLEQLGPYRLLKKLGAGGMGTVWKARHTVLDRVVAVKVLNPARLSDPVAVARFDREVKAIGRLEHPHIVNATDAGEDRGVHYLAMEFVDGINLSQLQRRLATLPAAEACELIRQAAVGLQYVHQQGQVHRDIKPSNLMLCPMRNAECGSRNEGESRDSAFRTPHSALLKILDLGLALLAAEKQEDTAITSTGQILGTVDYMSPEQLKHTHHVDIRTDVYGLGATLHKLLTGHVPFSGEEYGSKWQKLAALESDPVPSIRRRRPDLPEPLVTIVDRMLSRNPEDRFHTPQEVAQALAPLAEGADLLTLYRQAQALADGESCESPGSEVAVCQPAPPAHCRRRRAAWLAAGCVLLAVASLVVWRISRPWRSTQAASHSADLAASVGEKISDPRHALTPHGGADDVAPNITAVDAGDDGNAPGKELRFVDTGQVLIGDDPTGGRSKDTALGDLDGDGDLDAVVANGRLYDRDGDGLSQVWLNDGSGILTQGQALAMGNGINEHVKLGDVDGDDDLDILFGQFRSPPNVLWINDGSANFTSRSLPDLGDDARGVAFGDVDGDGDLDIVGTGRRIVLKNDGLGRFSVFAAGFSAGGKDDFDVVLVDLDGDKDLDTVFATNSGGNSIWLNTDGQGRFALHQTLGISSRNTVAVADFDGDGDADLVAPVAGSHQEIWLNDGTANFTREGSVASGGHTPTTGDVDGDGDVDIIVDGPQPVFLNDGRGHFTNFRNDPPLDAGWGTTLGDLDGDGDLDLYVARGGSDADTSDPDAVFLNELAPPFNP